MWRRIYTFGRDGALQASESGNDDDVEAAPCDDSRGCSKKSSGCHEAAETRVIRVRNTFFNDAFPQRHCE